LPDKKNIVLLSYADNRGDGIAAVMLTKCLREAGYNAVLMVRYKTRSDHFIIEAYNYVAPVSFRRQVYQRIKNKFISASPAEEAIKTDPKYDFFPDEEDKELLPVSAIINNLPFNPDLIVVGAMHSFVNTNSLGALKDATGAMIYFLMTDMFPITGGCQHAWDCEGYQSDCSNCPAIIEKSQKHLAARSLQIKLRNKQKWGFKILAGSGRTLMQAQASALYKDEKVIHNINSVIDVEVFNNRNRDQAKAIFNIFAESKVIFTGAEYTHTGRKGYNYLVEALQILWNESDEISRSNISVLIAGKFEGSKKNDLIDQIPFKKLFIEYITDDRLLALAYQAADVYVCPSIEDPGPLMVSQALSCGTPVVGFKMGLLYNMIENDFNGYKAELRDSRDLAEGMKRILSLSVADYKAYSNNAVMQVNKYSSKAAFLDIIETVLNDSD
jgi:glycosyltransferase involved in cell wall biosynthesis